MNIIFMWEINTVILMLLILFQVKFLGRVLIRQNKLTKEDFDKLLEVRDLLYKPDYITE